MPRPIGKSRERSLKRSLRRWRTMKNATTARPPTTYSASFTIASEVVRTRLVRSATSARWKNCTSWRLDVEDERDGAVVHELHLDMRAEAPALQRLDPLGEQLLSSVRHEPNASGSARCKRIPDREHASRRSPGERRDSRQAAEDGIPHSQVASRGRATLA